MEAGVTVAAAGIQTRCETAVFEFSFHAVGVPVVDLECDVINDRLHRGIRRCGLPAISGDYACAGIPETKPALRGPIVIGDGHAHQIGIEITGSLVVGHLIRDVVQRDRLEAMSLGLGNPGRNR